MTPKVIVAVALVVAVLLAGVRLILWHRSAAGTGPAPRPWRLVVLLGLQPICAALLFLCLFPPGVRVASGTFMVATAGTPGSAVATTGARLIALPEAPGIAGAEPAPDLATALRRYPDVQQITVLGVGLTARDRDAVADQTGSRVGIAFDPVPLPPGLISLDPPEVVAAGGTFRVGGRLSGLPGATIDLIDPAGRVTDSRTVDEDGRFVVAGTARSSGSVSFALQVRDARRRPVERAEVPVTVTDGPAPRLLIMAGAPGPEVKYLRRWATDAGFAVTTQAIAGGGITLGDAPVSIDGAGLRRFDAVIIDDRAWAGLGAGRSDVIATVRDGLGLVLRTGGAPDDGFAGQWRALGFVVAGSGDIVPVALPASPDAEVARTRRGISLRDAMPETAADPTSGEDVLPEIGRLSVTPGGEASVPLVKDAGGATLSAWRAIGRGRVAVFTGIDSFGLILTGRNDLYGDWWGTMISAVARPVDGVVPAFSGPAWVGDRAVLCGVSDEARVERPDGSVAVLRTGSGERGCAAFWPSISGWYRLRRPGTGSGEQDWPFFVHPADQLSGVRTARDRDATLMLRAQTQDTAGSDIGNPERPGSPWPWFIAWLVASALLWWVERSGFGRSIAKTASTQ